LIYTVVPNTTTIH
jgi:hypothetical protein